MIAEAASASLVWIAGLYAAGFALVILEVFIPGWVAGTAGILSILLSVWLAWSAHSAVLAGALAVGAVVGLPGILIWGMNRVAMKKELSAQEGYVAVGGEALQAQVGRAGVAATVLRPSGAVELGAGRFDARSDRGMIERGAAVEVLRVEGGELIVREAPAGTAPGSGAPRA